MSAEKELEETYAKLVAIGTNQFPLKILETVVDPDIMKHQDEVCKLILHHRSISLKTENCPGIPPEIKDKILQPFFTTKKGTAGTGLGLSISNDIIKAHGGDISIESVENARTTFVIKIPNDLITLISHG